MPTVSVVQILTASIAPVIVISGIGLLLLSITNRYGRVIDRARQLIRRLEELDPESAHSKHLEEQLQLIHQRARTLRLSMIYGSWSIFFVALTILALFAEQVFRLRMDVTALPLFAISLIALLVSIYYSICDINVSLKALELELSSQPGKTQR